MKKYFMTLDSCDYSVTLSTHFHLVQRLRVNGAISPLTHASLWRGTSLSKGTILP